MQTEGFPWKARAEEVWRGLAENVQMSKERNLFTYLLRVWRKNSLWSLMRKMLDWLRRIRLVAIIIRAVSLVLGILQTGALVILSTLILLIALPLSVALMLGILLTALLETRKNNRLLLAATEGKQVYVLFLPREAGDFFIRNAQSLAAASDTAVLVVSPYWISPRGVKNGYFYCTVRREAPSLYLVRKYYFFSLRKNVLEKRKTAYLY